MTYYISRDYSATTTGYATNRFHVIPFYQLQLFLNKILGYSVVGQTAWNIDGSATTVSIASGTLGTPPVVTTSTPHGLSTGQVINISGAAGNGGFNGTWVITVVDSTNFSLNNASITVGSPLTGGTITSGIRYASGKVATSNGAGINFSGAPTAVSIPLSVRTVVAGDVGKILVLKSYSNPTRNSGLFKISSVDTVNNRYVIDYRSTDAPPPEASNTMDWWLYENEVTASNYLMTFSSAQYLILAATNTSPIQVTTSSQPHFFNTGQTVTIGGGTGNTGVNGTWVITVIDGLRFTLNGSTGNGTYNANTAITSNVSYQGTGGFNSRIILQSPHPTGWQVRLCAETLNFQIAANLPVISVAVGFGGTSTGDFPQAGQHTLTPQITNSNPSGGYVNSVPGMGITNTASRTTIVGDTGGQGVFLYTRSLGATNNGVLFLGIPDNEPVPNYPNSDRVCCYGSAVIGDFGGLVIKTTAGNNIGTTLRFGFPQFMTVSGWANLDGTSVTSPFYSSNAGDCPFTGTTEVIPFEIWGGATADPALAIPQPSAGATLFSINQRFMGTLPFIRNGRNNFGNFTLSTDSATFSVLTASNTSPIQITTTAANTLVTGQSVTITGVTGNTAANGTWTVTVIDSSNFTLNGSSGNGNFISGGTVTRNPSWLHLQNGIYLMWTGPAGLTV